MSTFRIIHASYFGTDIKHRRDGGTWIKSARDGGGSFQSEDLEQN